MIGWPVGRTKDRAQVQIGAELLCKSAKVGFEVGTAPLLGGAVAVKIKIKIEGEDKKNDVAGFRAIAGSSVPSSIPKAATSEPATKPAAPPWAKK